MKPITKRKKHLFTILLISKNNKMIITMLFIKVFTHCPLRLGFTFKISSLRRQTIWAGLWFRWTLRWATKCFAHWKCFVQIKTIFLNVYIWIIENAVFKTYFWIIVSLFRTCTGLNEHWSKQPLKPPISLNTTIPKVTRIEKK